MAEYDRRGGGGNSNPRKRRYRPVDDNDNERRGPRRRFDAPPHVRIRRQLLSIAENPMRPWHEEVKAIAHLLTDNWQDEMLRSNFVDLALQLAVEQPLKTPFVAAVVLVANTEQPDLLEMLLQKSTGRLENSVNDGDWHQVKLDLKLLACLQDCLEGDGVFPILQLLLEKAVALRSVNAEDTIGFEIVKIILLTLPYVMSTGAEKWTSHAKNLLIKSNIITTTPHTLQALIDPYHMEGQQESPTARMNTLSLLQMQLQTEEASCWKLTHLPRPWMFPPSEVEVQQKLADATKHIIPSFHVPERLSNGPRALFPDVYFSVYMDHEFESVPPVTTATASLVRDALVDTITALHCNRNVTARLLIDLDCFFAPKTFAARATPFDRLREIEPPKSTWKPEDVAVDAVFSQLFQLPNPEHKLVFYHSVLTEACKQAPAAIAPSLGRAIRYLYTHVHCMDLELVNRFTDWFSHHLSNFGFTWKWTEWVGDVYLSDLHANKAFIAGAIDKEIRLSFAQRIKGTLPEPYQAMISEDTVKDLPELKFEKDQIPLAAEGREVAALLKRKVPEEEMQQVIDRIYTLANDANLNPLVTITDIFVTGVLHVGNKSLSHVLAAIERTKDRLLDMGAASEAARAQIISAVMSYWVTQTGVAITIIEKLLNYSVLTPASVVKWALIFYAGATRGEALAKAHIYEMVLNTTAKVTGRVRQLVQKVWQGAVSYSGIEGEAAPSVELLQATRDAEIAAMRELFQTIEDALVSWASGSKTEAIEMSDGDGERDKLVRRWGQRWLRVFRRKAVIEEAFLVEALRERQDEDAMASQPTEVMVA